MNVVSQDIQQATVRPDSMQDVDWLCRIYCELSVGIVLECQKQPDKKKIELVALKNELVAIK